MLLLTLTLVVSTYQCYHIKQNIYISTTYVVYIHTYIYEDLGVKFIRSLIMSFKWCSSPKTVGCVILQSTEIRTKIVAGGVVGRSQKVQTAMYYVKQNEYIQLFLR